MKESWDEKLTDIYAEKMKSVNAEMETNNGGRKRSGKGGNVDLRSDIAREAFKALPKAEQDALQKRAKDHAKALRKEYEDALKAPPSKKPEDIQR